MLLLLAFESAPNWLNILDKRVLLIMLLLSFGLAFCNSPKNAVSVSDCCGLVSSWLSCGCAKLGQKEFGFLFYVEKTNICIIRIIKIYLFDDYPSSKGISVLNGNVLGQVLELACFCVLLDKLNSSKFGLKNEDENDWRWFCCCGCWWAWNSCSNWRLPTSKSKKINISFFHYCFFKLKKLFLTDLPQWDGIDLFCTDWRS